MAQEVVRLLVDFGLVVLIWMVQLLIYPSFAYYSREALMRWHKKYTPRITAVVMPLMLGQLMLYGALIQEVKTVYTIGSFCIVLLVWLLTFAVFVPLHRSITKGSHSEVSLRRLTAFNWARTLLWTALFLWCWHQVS